MVNFELRKHLWGVADIGAIVGTRTQIYSRNCLSFFEFPCFLALGNKQTNKQNNFLNYLLYYWRGTYCYRCVCSSYLWCNKWNFNRLSHALKSPSILLRSPNFDCYLLIFVKWCGQVIISVAWWLAAIGAFWCGFTLREVDFILFKWLNDKHDKIIHAWSAKNERIFHVIRLQSSSTSTNVLEKHEPIYVKVTYGRGFGTTLE